MENNIYIEEQKYYESVKKNLENEIELCIEEIKKIPKKYTNVLQGDEFLIESMMNLEGNKLSKLKIAKSSPYFGRVDYTSENGIKHKIYVGKTNINSSTGEMCVTDWRTPVCNLYYDNNIGTTSYMSPTGEIYVNVDLKRQILIENEELKKVYDTSVALQDDILIKCLDVNADNKMKSIVASIQKEQNEIIRKPLNKNIIVQGVAGSGKTSVALHRIAYLAYNNMENLNSKNYMILGPNEYFLDYISQILPDLETEPVQQITPKDYLAELSGINCKLNNKLDNLEEKLKDIRYARIDQFKTSLYCKKAIDEFMKVFLDKMIVQSDFEIDGMTIFSKELVKEYLLYDYKNIPNYKKLRNVLTMKFKNEKENIFSKFNKEYEDIYTRIPFGEPARDIYVKKSEELRKKICVDGERLLKEYIKKITMNDIDIYKIFINNIEKFTTNLDKELIDYLKNNENESIKKKNISLSTMAPLLYIASITHHHNKNIVNLVIDEAQDYGLLHFIAFKNMFPKASFTIYGDLSQSLYSHCSVNSWEEVKNIVFEDKCDIIPLSKSYRTTKEITDISNNILKLMGNYLAEPVTRTGEPVRFCNNVISKNTLPKILELYYLNNYKSLAIICKTSQEAKKISRDLQKLNVESSLILGDENKYNAGICVTTAYASKGLEFDCVIINDASENIYNSDNIQDMHLLYVACTRALHQLIICHSQEITKSLNNQSDFIRIRK